MKWWIKGLLWSVGGILAMCIMEYFLLLPVFSIQDRIAGIKLLLIMDTFSFPLLVVIMFNLQWQERKQNRKYELEQNKLIGSDRE